MAEGLTESEWPSALRDKPTLLEVNRSIWEGWVYLTNTRSRGMSGAEPIAIGAIRDWLDFDGVTDADERKDFLFFISSLDRVFMDHVNEKREQEINKAKPNPTGKAVRK